MITYLQRVPVNKAQALRWGMSYAKGYLALDMAQEAIAELDRLPGTIQHRADVIYLRNRALTSQKDWISLLQQAQLGTCLFPEVIEFHIQRALAYENLEQNQEAKKAWLSSPSPFRQSGFVHYNLARCEAKLGNLFSAHQHLERAIAIDPEIKGILAEDPDFTRLLKKSQLN